MFETIVLFLYSQCLLLAGQTLVSGHIHLTTSVPAYKDHSCKQAVPVIDTFTATQGCLLTRASIVQVFTAVAFPKNFRTLLLHNSQD